ncbi:bifunctional DNA-formamidopyrimidine glycosylase/DNA-(apurinic or apyrimidinic site) lyase [Sutterella sp.]|uniref:bifunctional DNA-formamidopyrimidine glycosylase/DNA-(apurinic or apyrimidinic site) lyase n=1 Tax=Sutterella sp. TaxID=1981025 RepID=UPI0026DF3286|nr:bifunctional DNA-formamidopyrimidine glycosylase/DNA-(apurinic or apyrimidinic site) lyase [Sutterella sp.]MDO5531890.1 bifunctional DNA-formamidopyrimidine glycosylase/DNA-(apurinic or apyrimidinic site) lyase [Sutterella sp.]
MPELPEIESVRRMLEPGLHGRRVEAVDVRRADVVAHPDAETFRRLLTGAVFTTAGRRGKFLVLGLAGAEGPLRLVIHLRMTGCLLLAPAGHPEEKHTHVVLSLSDSSGGTELRFSDTRRFGRLWLLEEGESDALCGIDRLGVEPLSPALTAEYLSSKFGRSARAIKSCLLDQSVIAGIGNIYSDEILFSAGIHPERAASGLTAEEWECLAEVIPERLGYFCAKNEMTSEEALDLRGRDYRNTPFLQVYGHEGHPCPVCGSALRRIVVGGRSSVFCPECQSIG